MTQACEVAIVRVFGWGKPIAGASETIRIGISDEQGNQYDPDVLTVTHVDPLLGAQAVSASRRFAGDYFASMVLTSVGLHRITIGGNTGFPIAKELVIEAVAPSF